MKKVFWSILAIILSCLALGSGAYRLQKPSDETKKESLIIY